MVPRSTLMFHRVYSIKALGRTVGSLSENTHTRFRPSVLYADRGVIALNKPPGLVSQGSTPGTEAGTVHNHSRENRLDTVQSKSAFNAVLDDLRRRYDLSTGPYPVHRLDKGTTGVLMLARTKVLARELSQQFRTHEIGKTYLALVLGGSREFSAKQGLISRSLSSDNGRVQLGTEEGPGSKPAFTMWEVLAFSDKAPLSLVRLYPRTGLKHQLRVHMAHTLQAPILGDTLYGNATSAQQILAPLRIPESRLFLHSSSISFWRYRRTGTRKRFRLTIVAPLPADFIKVCREMGLQPPDIAIQGGVFVDGEYVGEGEIPDVGGRWLGGPV
ncbi:pseudouridine synthase [Lactarius indigo]|nr:pseudouridine synthase [Lactarius indigo]